MANPLRIDGLDELIAKLQSLTPDIADEVAFTIQDSANIIARNAQRDAPVNNSFLKQGIGTKEVTPLTWEITSNAEYSAWVEFGTRSQVSIPAGLETFAAQYIGTKRATSLGAKEAIFAWCKSKGIDPKAWYAIFISIMVKGSKPHPFFFKNYVKEKPVLIAKIKAILER